MDGFLLPDDIIRLAERVVAENRAAGRRLCLAEQLLLLQAMKRLTS